MTEWRCFHCGDLFTDQSAARDHFGLDEGATPACVIKGSEGGLVMALREAEAAAANALAMMHSESTDVEQAYQNFRSRHENAVSSAEQTGYERGLNDRRHEIERLRRIVARYGDRVAMANCHRSDWQIEIDEALGFCADNPDSEASHAAVLAAKPESSDSEGGKG